MDCIFFFYFIFALVFSIIVLALCNLISLLDNREICLFEVSGSCICIYYRAISIPAQGR